MKNAVEAEFVDLPSLVNCQFVDVFVSIHTVKVQNAGKMKEEMDVRKRPVTVSSVRDLKNAGEGVGALVVDSGCCNDSGLTFREIFNCVSSGLTLRELINCVDYLSFPLSSIYNLHLCQFQSSPLYHSFSLKEYTHS